ncbi:phage/plasmid primase, P4 family [Leuconostoc lactis]|uniref:phage/plasmid primase, P4 family n=1 Tax=Leuconostoc lactis TaxID=1246 RepID=UPI00289CE8ED|nr:phage/plasmid primase, P4 family [Leuconostoc lactis]
MAEINTAPLPQQNNMPDWLNVDENGNVKGIDTLKLSETIIKNNPILGVPFNGSIRYYKYNGISWENLTEKSARAYIEREALENLKQYNAYNVKRMQDVSKTTLIQTISEHNPFEDQRTDIIAFKNGTYEIENGRITPNKESYYLVNGHDIDINKDGQAPNIEAWGSYLFGNSWQFIKELLGYAFIPEYKTFNTIAIIVDEMGGTGKSYFFDTIVFPLLGTKNIVAKDMDTIAGSNGKSARFGLIGLFEKLSNIHLDLPDTRIEVPDTLRSLSGGDRIDVEAKNADALSLKFYALLLFGANQTPNIAVNVALSQRVKIVPVTAPRARERPQEQAKRALLWDEKQAVNEVGAFAYSVLTAYQQAKQRGKFSTSDEIETATREWLERQDLITMFLKDTIADNETDLGGGASVSQTWDLFQIWLQENGIHSKLQRKQFNSRMEQLGYEKIKTRLHQVSSKTDVPVWSWSGLSLDKYFNE